MKTQIHIDRECKEPRLILITPELTDKQQALLSLLESDGTIPGYQGQQVTPLPLTEISRFYTARGQVMAQRGGRHYTIRHRLYELEDILEETDFIRISQGELVSLNHVERFDLSFSGTVRVELKSGDSTFVSRRYVKKLKQALGI